MENHALYQTVLSHVLWIGGGTDAGKTTVAKVLANRHGLQLYHYDQHDLSQTQKLAETILRYREGLNRSAEEKWMGSTPEELMQRSLRHMADRFPLVIEELLLFPKEPMILAEGFGLTPELVSPLLLSPNQAVWLAPTEEFTWESMKRRSKPSWRNQVSDPELAFQNSFKRNRLLATHFQQEAIKYGQMVYEVDGTLSGDEMASLLEQHFAPMLVSAKTD